MAFGRDAQQPAVRKSFLVGGAIIVAVAVIGFVFMTFVSGGGGSTEIVAAPAAEPSVEQPAGGAVPSTGAQAFPKNVLKAGGDDPFIPKVSGVKPAAAPAADSSAAAAGTQPGLVGNPLDSATNAATLHTWQLLDLGKGTATFLVDGKKVSKLVPGDKIVEGYTFNSVTGECVTVKKGVQVFGLCPGAAPFAQ